MAKKTRNKKISRPLVAPIRPPKVTISQVVHAATEKYLSETEPDEQTDLYDLVLQEVESAMLQAVLTYTEDNQSETAIILGLNRGTLRKKLHRYGFL